MARWLVLFALLLGLGCLHIAPSQMHSGHSHIHTLDDPKDAIDYSAHELLERAKSLGFRVLASANIRLNLRPIQRWPRT